MELDAIAELAKSPEKGRRLERLIAEIFGSIAGLALDAQDVVNAYDTEEMDLYFWNDRERDGLHFLDCPLVVECKGWSQPVSGRELRYFATMLKDKGRRSGIFVALKGLAGRAAARSAGFFHVTTAMAAGQTVLVVTEADLRTLNKTTDLVALLKRRMLDQVKGQILALNAKGNEL
jgi:Restriction endonuclease